MINNHIKIIPMEVTLEQKTNEADKVQRTSYGQSTVVILSKTTVRFIDDVSKFTTKVPIERIIELIKEEEERLLNKQYSKVEIVYT